MGYFDYERIAAEARIPGDKLKALCDMFRRDYPCDQLLYELHVLRACLRSATAT